MKKEVPPKSATPPSSNQAKAAGGGGTELPKSPPGTPGVKHPVAASAASAVPGDPHTPSSLSELNPPSNNREVCNECRHEAAEKLNFSSTQPFPKVTQQDHKLCNKIPNFFTNTLVNCLTTVLEMVQ